MRQKMKRQVAGTLAGVLVLWGTAFRAGAKPVFTKVTPNLPSVQRLGKFELTFQLSKTTYKNPYDPDQINVSAVFTSPSRKSVTVYGFYYQEFTRTGPPEKLTGGDWSWRVRFCPNEPGVWTYRLQASEGKKGKAAFGPQEFTCVPSGRKGYVRVSPKDNRYLQYEDGSQYFPVGENVGWGDDPGGKYAHGGGTFDYDRWIYLMAKSGGNFTRYWMCPWYHSVEWKQSGLGNYSGLMSDAWRLDHDLDLAWSNNVTVMLMLLNHGAVSTEVNPNWKDSPYNKANGGPCAGTHEFFTDPAAQKYFKRRLRYIVARWGYASNLIWEMCNEMDQTDKFNKDPAVRKDVTAWIDRMARYIKSMDSRHVVTTSYSEDKNDPAAWNLPVIDFTQYHFYSGASALEDALRSVTANYRSLYPGKPVFGGEFGTSWMDSQAELLDPEGIAMHNVLWGTALGEGAGAAAMWFWDNVIDPRDLYRNFVGISHFAHEVDFQNSAFVFKTPLTTSASRVDFNVAPGNRAWGMKAGASEFTVSTSGEITPSQGNLCQYLFGKSKPEFRNPPTFQVDYPAAGKFKVEVSDLNPSKKGTLLIQVDGKTALKAEVKPNSGYSVPVSKGPHRILVDSVGDDWFTVGAYLFSPYVSALKVYCLQGPNTIAAWVANRNYNYTNVHAHGKPAAVSGTLHFTGVAHDGPWKAWWWNTQTGIISGQAMAVAKGGKMDLPVPPTAWDWGLKMVYQGSKLATGDATVDKGGFPWPRGAKAAVSLTYDDAIPSQLNNAIPALDKRGLKGTFFLEGRNVGKDNEDRWMSAGREGHEIACHTISHPCDKKMDFIKKGNALEDYTLGRMSKELDDSIALGRKLSGREGPFTFAYPCGESYVGEGKDQQSYVPLVAQKFLAARTVEPGIEDPASVSLPEVHTMEGSTAEKLIGAVQKAEAQGGWVVFLFHGVGGDYLTTDLKAHDGLLDYLAKHKDKVWTGTFADVAGYVKKNK